jgi:hypothetical protein
MPWINRLAFKRQHCEHALMDPLQRFTSDEEFQRLGTEGEEEGMVVDGWSASLSLLLDKSAGLILA